MSAIIRKRGFYRGNFPRKAEFLTHVKACFDLARTAIPGCEALPNVPVVFYPKGRTAGQARWSKDKHTGVITQNVEFSVEAIGIEWDDMVGDTIPHEVAHIVDCFINGPYRKQKHGRRWKAIAAVLGCGGKRCHSYSVTPARKRRRQDRFEYIGSCGTSIWVTRTMHNKIQRGTTRIIRATGGKITATDETGDVQHN